MRNIVSLCVWTLSLVCSFLFAEEKKAKEELYLQLNRAIIRLEHFEETKKEGSNKVIDTSKADGTAFFVLYNNSIFVISARHVVEKPYDLHARVQVKNDITGDIETFLLNLKRDRWIYHFDHGDNDTRYVDVAVTKIKPKKGIKWFRYEMKDSEKYAENHLPEKDPVPPKQVIVFGFPGNIGFDLSEQIPFGRQGIVSMSPNKEMLKFRKKYYEERCCILDIESFPGNSGSPVIGLNPFGGDLKLLGLVIASNKSMDFSIMEPVSRIRETLDIAKNQSFGNVGFWENY